MDKNAIRKSAIAARNKLMDSVTDKAGMSDRPFLDKMDMPGGFKESALRLMQFTDIRQQS